MPSALARSAVAVPMRPSPTTPKTRPESRRIVGGVAKVPAGVEIGLQRVVIGDDAAGQRQHQCDGMIGHIGGAVIRRVADGNAERSACGDIDLVEADAGAHDQAAAIQPLDQRTVEIGIVIADDGVVFAPEWARHRAEFRRRGRR